MRLAAILAAISCLPAQDAPRWLVGPRIVDARSGEVAGRLGNPEPLAYDTPLWLGSDQFLRGECVVDLASGRLVDLQHGWLALRDHDGKAEWAIRALASFDVGCCPTLTAERVVFVDRDHGGINALDRATGKLEWRQAGCPCDLIAIDGDLVIGADQKQPRGRELGLSAFALSNGKTAFEVRLPGPARRIVASDAGIAAIGANFTVVHDRFGPRLFELAGEVVDLRSGAGAWFVVTKERVEARDRAGNQLWSEKRVTDDLTRVALTLTSDGKPLIWRHHTMSDSGIGLVCRDPRDGHVLWQHRERGLGVPLLAKGHLAQVRCRGDSVFLLSQGGSGTFLVELDATNGAHRDRHELEK